MRIDLHTHSSRSDGTDSPAELIRNAHEAGLDVVAITDHDTTSGWDEAAATADQIGIHLVRGIEISTNVRGQSVHLLGYEFDPTYEPLVEELDRVRGGRDNRLPLIVRRLNELGFDLTIAEVEAQSVDATSTGRPHIADALVARGDVANRAEAFDRFLAEGKPAHVGRYSASLPKAIELLTQAGGVPVVAHPWSRGSKSVLSEADLAALVSRGLVGIEVDHQDHDAAARDELRGIARNLDLVITGSSDYHGTGKVNHPLGVNTTDPEQYARLFHH